MHFIPTNSSLYNIPIYNTHIQIHHYTTYLYIILIFKCITIQHTYTDIQTRKTKRSYNSSRNQNSVTFSVELLVIQPV
ncbi:hypothetical protein EB796_006859 [Bugula neritina]|uniref:Uncharacterized protein n=1 Tax=Bugula neritina TaxID=10212 RepID=A0A7J7KB41_BUGNE|nr:hypothetical protein EB796_006859 [Bugula neritina]